MPPNSSTLLEIYDKITVENCSYCFLCFRTGTERRLKVPQSEIKSTTLLGKSADIHNKPPHICFMCEALALAAAKFRKAAFFATSIDNLFKNMIKSDEYRTEIRRLLNNEEEPTVSSVFKSHRTLFIDEKELAIYRKNMQLQLTDVVVIDSNDVFTNDRNPTHSTFANDLDSSTFATDLLDDSSSEMEIHITTPGSPSEDIIILDDNPPPPKGKSTIRRSLRTTSRTKSKDAPILKNHSLKKKQTISKAKEVVPVDKLVQEFKTQTRPTLVGKVKPEPVVLNETTVGYLHPMYKRPDGTHTVPTLSAQIVNGQLILFQGQQHELLSNGEQPKPLIFENHTTVVPSPSTHLDQVGDNNVNNVENIKKEVDTDQGNEDISEVVDKMLVEKLEDMKKSKRIEKVVVDGENKVVKEPLKKNDRIDWEDKIPMDVISFMDATDPNPPSFIQPLMPPAIISDVRSLQHEDKDRGKEDVIDLC